MRIIGEFDIDGIKTTVFVMNERISVKYEYQLMEQTYKFRDGSGIQSLADVERFSMEKTSERIKQIFTEMAKIRTEALVSMATEEDDEFDVIL
ncbi:MAG: hypothetical protein WAU01_04655 [Saprospiraceae bacterium]